MLRKSFLECKLLCVTKPVITLRLWNQNSIRWLKTSIGPCIRNEFATKKDIISTHRPDLDVNSEILWSQIELVGEKSIPVGAFYRPPNTDLAYLKTLGESLSTIKKSQHSNIWLAGDFNLGDIVWSSQSVKSGTSKVNISNEFINTAADFGLEQMINKPARRNIILDLFFTTNSTLVKKGHRGPRH